MAQPTAINAPRIALAVSVAAGSLVNSRTEAKNTGVSEPAVASTPIRATRGSRISTASTLSWIPHEIGATDGLQVAAKRPQPLSSPSPHPMPRATGNQATNPRTSRERSDGWSSSSQRRSESTAASTETSAGTDRSSIDAAPAPADVLVVGGRVGGAV